MVVLAACQSGAEPDIPVQDPELVATGNEFYAAVAPSATNDSGAQARSPGPEEKAQLVADPVAVVDHEAIEAMDAGGIGNPPSRLPNGDQLVR